MVIVSPEVDDLRRELCWAAIEEGLVKAEGIGFCVGGRGSET